MKPRLATERREPRLFLRESAGLIFLLVVVGVVDAFHEDFAVGDAVGEGATEQALDGGGVGYSFTSPAIMSIIFFEGANKGSIKPLVASNEQL